MTYDVLARGALDYLPCRYGNSKLQFRGPRRRLDGPYVAFLGGTEFYGKFITAPVPALVESDLGVNCVNFGQCNAGLEVFVNDQMMVSVSSKADVTVLQVLGAHNLSNRLYMVHPRRNDRFVAPSGLLRTMYSEVDFAEFHYNKHLLRHLFEVCPSRFAAVRAELETAWLARMKMLIDMIEGKVVLLWMSDHAPLAQDSIVPAPDLSQNPLFVSREMLDEIAPRVDRVVEVVFSREAMKARTEGMVYGDMDAPAAAEMFGPRAHGETAFALGPVLHDVLGT
jgi:hypothetical protein